MVAVEQAMSSGSRELSSWKEIAHHLGVNIRTAQKWERERALPVRRSSGPKGRVGADTSALDLWKQQLAETAKAEDRCYSWPLGRGLTVELRFFGPELTPGHIDLLRSYLDLVKNALANNVNSAPL